jgi:hypothetical protein
MDTEMIKDIAIIILTFTITILLYFIATLKPIKKPRATPKVWDRFPGSDK